MMMESRNPLLAARIGIEYASNHTAVGVDRLHREHRERLRFIVTGTKTDAKVVALGERRLGRLAGERSAWCKAIILEARDHQLRGRIDGNAAQRERLSLIESANRRPLPRRFQRQPDESVPLGDRKTSDFNGARRRVGRMSWNVGTAGSAIGVAPPVILAFELAAIVNADR